MYTARSRALPCTVPILKPEMIFWEAAALHKIIFSSLPNNPRELHRYLITGFLISGMAISVLIGALVYYWESWRVEKMAFELAVVSAKHFDSPEMRKLLIADRSSNHPELAELLEKSSFLGILFRSVRAVADVDVEGMP